jgi:hypothetical protein
LNENEDRLKERGKVEVDPSIIEVKHAEHTVFDTYIDADPIVSKEFKEVTLKYFY